VVLQVDDQFNLGTIGCHFVRYLIHQRPHEENPPSARLEEILFFQRIRDIFGIETSPFIFYAKDELILADNACDMDELPFVAFIPVKNAVIDGFCTSDQQTIKGAVVQPGDFIHLNKERLDPSDLLLIAFAVEVVYLRRGFRLRMRLSPFLIRSG